MIEINHIAAAARNLYEAAHALRRQTGLGFYDGGFNPGGTGNKIFPMGGGAYLQLSGIVDAHAVNDPAQAGAKRATELVRGRGEVFQSLNLRGGVADLEAIAARHGLKVAENATGRTQANGRRLRVVALSATPPGVPMVYSFPDFPDHPAAHYPDPAPGLVTPMGISFVELGGTRASVVDWIGEEAVARLPLRFTGGPPGVTAFGVRTAAGEIVIRTPFQRAAT